jgi:heme exporter protein D
VDDASWAALTLSLTVAGGIWTWLSFRRRGLASGLRALAFTLLPLAAYLTKTLRMFTQIADAIGTWAANLAFNPFVWSGIVVAGVSVVLFVVSGMLRARELGKGGAGKAGSSGELPAKGSAKGTAKGTPALSGDDDLAEIEALLRKRGIT